MQQGGIKVGVIGATGFSGIELLHLLSAHPGVSLEFAASDQKAGASLSSVIGPSAAFGHLSFVTREQARAALPVFSKSQGATLFLATPADVSREWVGLARELELRCVDLSGALRLEDEALATHHYGRFAGSEVYGLPELFRERIQSSGSKIVSNPGCYATAAALSLAPLLKQELIEPEWIAVSAVSGVSGAGRKASEEFGFMAIDADVRAYRVLAHQHEPEIVQTLSLASGTPVSRIGLTFTPHLVPLKRGILSTATARLVPGVTEARVRAAFEQAYAREPMVQLGADASDVRIADVAGTNLCRVGFTADEAGRRIVVTSAIDNLIKGSAGQAIQNFNLMHGFEETAALSSLRRFHT